MALADVSKKIAKGTVAATALPAFMAFDGLSRAIKPVTRAVMPKNILTSFANELDYFPIKAGFDQVYDKLNFGGKKKTDTTKPKKKEGLSAEEPVPVIVKNTEDIKPEEEKPLIERLPSNFFSTTGESSSINRGSSIDTLLSRANELLEDIKEILGGQLLIQKKDDQKKKLKGPIEDAKKREQEEEAKRIKTDYPETTEKITQVDGNNGLGLLGSLALLSRGAIMAGIGGLVLAPFLKTFVDDLAQDLNIQELIPGDMGMMLDGLVKERAGDFAGKVATFVGAKFLFGTKAAMLSVLADEVIRQFENMTDIDVPDYYEGAISIAAGALAARYGKSIVTKLIPSINKTLALRFAGVLSAISLVNAIPDTPEDLQKFMDDNKKKSDDLSNSIYEKVGKPLNDLLGFEFIRPQDDYENSPANKMFTGVFEDAGKSPREMEMEHEIRISKFQGKAADDFDMGRYQDPDYKKLSDIQSNFFKKNMDVVPEVPESINKNNQTLLNSNKAQSPNVIQYNDNRQFNQSTRSGGGSGSPLGNMPVSTTPPVSPWTRQESTITPH